MKRKTKKIFGTLREDPVFGLTFVVCVLYLGLAYAAYGLEKGIIFREIAVNQPWIFIPYACITYWYHKV